MASFWDIKIPADCSWGLRSILKVKDQALPHARHLIGNGMDTLFWLDPWLPCGRLMDSFGSRAVYDLSLGRNIRVSKFLQNGVWGLLATTTNAFIDIFHRIHVVTLTPQLQDKIIWMASECGSFSTRSCYFSVGQPIYWRDLVLFSGSVPKLSLCAWMAFCNGLKTRVHLANCGTSCDIVCCLCNSSKESCSHLFTECHFGQKIWSKIVAKLCAGGARGYGLSAFFNNFYDKCTFNSVGESIPAKLCITFFIWHVWRERNLRIFGGKSSSWEVILVNITQQIQSSFIYLNLKTSAAISAP